MERKINMNKEHIHIYVEEGSVLAIKCSLHFKSTPLIDVVRSVALLFEYHLYKYYISEEV